LWKTKVDHIIAPKQELEKRRPWAEKKKCPPNASRNRGKGQQGKKRHEERPWKRFSREKKKKKKKQPPLNPMGGGGNEATPVGKGKKSARERG